MPRPTPRDPGDETVYACDACGDNIVPAEGVLTTCCPPCESELAIWTDGTDTVIATNEEDCARALAELTCSPYEDYLENGWKKYGKTELTILFENDETGKMEPDTRTVAEWIRIEGRGFLCSTEY